MDNLYNSSKVAVDRIELICGKRPVFYEVDVTDETALDHVLAKHPEIDSVIHFAALKVRVCRLCCLGPWSREARRIGRR